MSNIRQNETIMREFCRISRRKPEVTSKVNSGSFTGFQSMKASNPAPEKSPIITAKLLSMFFNFL